MDNHHNQLRDPRYQGPHEGSYHYASTSSRLQEDREYRIREHNAPYEYQDERAARYQYYDDHPEREHYYRSPQYSGKEKLDDQDERHRHMSDALVNEERKYQEDRRYYDQYNNDQYNDRGDRNRAQDDHREEGTAQYQRQHPDDRQYNTMRRSAPPSQLRLVKLTSDVLPESQQIAVIDGRSNIVSIGRDRIFTPRVRCASMEVSKNHANIFKMTGDQRGRSSDAVFAITDTGSTHGTHLLLDPPLDLSRDSLPPVKAYQRLSPPKKASLPKTLRHLCLLKIGQTIFQAHLHSGTVTCSECTLNEDGSNEIPLLERKEKPDAKSDQKEAVQAAAPIRIAPQEALKALKNRHLGDEAEEDAPLSNYVDRAAARRARGGTQDQKKSGKKTQTDAIPSRIQQNSSPAPTSEVAAKLNANNRGFKMFEAMASKGFEGSVGKYDDPVMARGIEGTAGLGSKRLLDVQEMASRPTGYSAESIRERQKRRFEESR